MTSKTLLIVDDSDFDRDLLGSALALKSGIKIVHAGSGEQCLQCLNEQKIDLVLLDILMPGSTGNEILAKIRERFNQIELPVIMVTSKSDVADIVTSLQAGANDYITKPVNFEIALSRISTHLKLAEVSREMSRLKEMAALDALITTYHHEINNPLTVAIAYLNSNLLKDEAAVEKIKQALWRIADIVQKIRETTDQKEIEYGTYSQSPSKLLKLK